jgi:plastocyanin
VDLVTVLQRRVLAVAGLGLLVLALSGFPAPATAAGTTIWTAQAGELFPEQSLSLNQFFPRDLTVVEGDTVVWERVVFHTISFLSGEDRPPFLSPLPDGRLGVLAGIGFRSGPLPRIEIEGIAQASWSADRRGVAEGVIDEKLVINGNNEYDGTGFFNSGGPFDATKLPRPVAVKFTESGIFELVCLVHSAMKATVTVLQTGSTAPDSQADMDARAAEELAASIAQADSLISTQEITVVAPTSWSEGRPNRTTVFGLTTGLLEDDVEYARFVPIPNLQIGVGDTVTWDWTKAGETPHTVTFLSGAEQPDYFLVERLLFADGSINQRDPPVIALNPVVWAPSGGDTYSGPDSGFVSSGVLFGEQGPAGRPTSYSLTFDTPGTFNYVCLMHGPRMSGIITVADILLPATGGAAPSTRMLLAAGVAGITLMLAGGLLMLRRNHSNEMDSPL